MRFILVMGLIAGCLTIITSNIGVSAETPPATPPASSGFVGVKECSGFESLKGDAIQNQFVKCLSTLMNFTFGGSILYAFIRAAIIYSKGLTGEGDPNKEVVKFIQEIATGLFLIGGPALILTTISPANLNFNFLDFSNIGSMFNTSSPTGVNSDPTAGGTTSGGPGGSSYTGGNEQTPITIDPSNDPLKLAARLTACKNDANCILNIANDICNNFSGAQRFNYVKLYLGANSANITESDVNQICARLASGMANSGGNGASTPTYTLKNEMKDGKIKCDNNPVITSFINSKLATNSTGLSTGQYNIFITVQCGSQNNQYNLRGNNCNQSALFGQMYEVGKDPNTMTSLTGVNIPIPANFDVLGSIKNPSDPNACKLDKQD